MYTKRKALPSDTDFARQTHHAAYRDVVMRQFGSFDEKTQDKYFAESWKLGNQEILLKDDKKVGYCSIEYLPNEIIIQQLTILPEFQSQGIGSELLTDVLKEAKIKGTPVKLQVLKKNRAKNLYEKLGFKEIGTTDTHFKMEFIFTKEL